MIYHYLLLLLVLFQDSPTAEQLRRETTEFHDPKGEWPTFAYHLFFRETRPDGPDRRTEVWIDLAQDYFKLNRNNEQIGELNRGKCDITVGDFDCARLETMKNYYTYLWGLPMKLNDRDTPLNQNVTEVVYKGSPCFQLQVDYEKDTWFFYLDKSSKQMLAYLFLKDVGQFKGEYIELEGILKIGQMSIPKKRNWYTLPDSTFLGSDILIDFEKL